MNSSLNFHYHPKAGGRLPEIQLRLLHMENGTEIPLQLGQLANLRYLYFWLHNLKKKN